MVVGLVKFTLQEQHNIIHVSFVYFFEWFAYVAIFKPGSYQIKNASCKVETKILLHNQPRQNATVFYSNTEH